MKASGIIPVVLSSCVNQKQPGSLLKMEVLLQGLCRFGLRGLGRVLEISIFHKVLHACELTVKVVQLCLTLCDSRDYTVHGILQARILEWVVYPFSRGSSQPRYQTQANFPILQADSLPAEPLGKPKNNGVGSLSLLQQIFLTQESNRGLPRC